MAKPPKITSIVHPLPKGGKAPLNFNGRAPSPSIVPEIGKQPKSDLDLAWDEMKKAKQAEAEVARDMVDSSKPKNGNKQSWVNQPWRDIVNNIRDKNTPSSVPPNILTGDAYPIVKPNPLDLSFNENTGFNWGTLNGSRPSYNPYRINEPIPSRRAPRYNLNLLKPPTPYESTSIVTRTAAEKALEQRVEKEMAREAAIKQGLWGLGVLGTGLGTMYGLSNLRDYIHSSSEQPQTQESTTSPIDVSSYDSPAQLLEANQPPLEQQYVTQGLPLSTRPPQSYPVDVADEELVEVPEGLNSSDLRYLTNGTVQGVSQGVNQQIRDYVRPVTTPAPVSTSTPTSTVTTQNPPVVRKQQSVSIDSTGPRVLNEPRAVSNQSNAPVTSNNLRAETALARAMVSPPNPDALHRARYQSLMNSGLKGMSPDEAIRSGLLTPEQVQVLMRGPF